MGYLGITNSDSVVSFLVSVVVALVLLREGTGRLDLKHPLNMHRNWRNMDKFDKISHDYARFGEI